jgi:hypothetical protein
MLRRSRNGIRWLIATAVVAVAFTGLPALIDIGANAIGVSAALADPGKGNGNANGHAKGPKDVGEQNAALSNAQLKKSDPLHPSNLGRLNGFLNASSSALLHASPNSAVGILSKTYRDALLDFDASSGTTTTLSDLAEILAEAANKPLSPEQITAINDKLAQANPEEFEGFADLTDDEKQQLADEANDIQATEANQGLGNGDSTDEAEGGVAEEVGGAVADAADTVTDAAEDAAKAIGAFFESTF